MAANGTALSEPTALAAGLEVVVVQDQEFYPTVITVREYFATGKSLVHFESPTSVTRDYRRRLT